MIRLPIKRSYPEKNFRNWKYLQCINKALFVDNRNGRSENLNYLGARLGTLKFIKTSLFFCKEIMYLLENKKPNHKMVRFF